MFKRIVTAVRGLLQRRRHARVMWLDSLWQDARYAARSLARRPGPTATATAMLGLGIGITTAMFTVVDALILRPVPFHDPDKLAFVYMGNDRGGRTNDRVLLSEDLWRTLYQSDPAIIGRSILIDGERLLVMGVLPADFRFPSRNTVIWRAVAYQAMPAGAANELPRAYVRFASNVPREDARRIATKAARAADRRNAGLYLRVQPLAGMVLDPYYQRALPLLAGGVVLVFLVLCANVSSLLLARLTARQREFRMRSALGASRGRLIRQALVESSVLGVWGVMAGVTVAWILVSLSRAFLPEAFLLRTLNPLDIDGRALAVTSVSGVVAIVAAGLAPAWSGTRTDFKASLRITEWSGTESRAARALTRTLLVGEIALACTLLVGATLLVRSFINLAQAERGLPPTGGAISFGAWQSDASSTSHSPAWGATP